MFFFSFWGSVVQKEFCSCRFLGDYGKYSLVVVLLIITFVSGCKCKSGTLFLSVLAFVCRDFPFDPLPSCWLPHGGGVTTCLSLTYWMFRRNSRRSFSLWILH